MLKMLFVAAVVVVVVFVLLSIDFSSIDTMMDNPIRNIVEMLFATFDGVR